MFSIRKGRMQWMFIVIQLNFVSEKVYFSSETGLCPDYMEGVILEKYIAYFYGWLTFLFICLKNFNFLLVLQKNPIYKSNTSINQRLSSDYMKKNIFHTTYEWFIEWFFRKMKLISMVSGLHT